MRKNRARRRKESRQQEIHEVIILIAVILDLITALIKLLTDTIKR